MTSPDKNQNRNDVVFEKVISNDIGYTSLIADNRMSS